MFSEEDEDTLQSLPLNVCDQTHASAERKRKKENLEKK
jgi:hypothetical protein